jgi:hypothetical protein
MSRIKLVKPDRGKIDLQADDQVRYWCKHLGVTRAELVKIIDKVGNSAAAVEKALGH